MTELRTIVLDGYEYVLDDDGEPVARVAISDEAAARDDAALYGATWSAPDGFKREPQYDVHSDDARRQAAAAVRSNLSWAMIAGDDAYLNEIANAKAGSLLAPRIREANKDPSEIEARNGWTDARCRQAYQPWADKVCSGGKWTPGRAACAVTSFPETGNGYKQAAKIIRRAIALRKAEGHSVPVDWPERADAGKRRKESFPPTR